MRRTTWAGAFIGLALFAAAFLVRWALADELSAFPFLTFFPAIMLTALLGGVRPAIAITIISAVAAWYYFVPPFQSFSIRPAEIVGLGFFFFVAGVNIGLIELLHHAIRSGRADRARAESLLAAREAMFKELQHRVANNMQFVSSMLTLQQRQVEGTPAAEALAQASARLRAMARIHRRLHDPANADRPFGALVEELCHELLEATGARNIVCRVDIPPLTLAPDRVHTLSMIITEALTNAVKHAFPDGRPGTIRISLERISEQEMSLIIADDGDGVPVGFQPANAASLGMKIMQALAQQLNGVFSFGPGARGAELRLSFSPT